MEPFDKKHPSFQKLNVDVKKLEDATWEAISGWTAENEQNMDKKVFIKDLFRIAKSEERYRDGLQGKKKSWDTVELPISNFSQMEVRRSSCRKKARKALRRVKHEMCQRVKRPSHQPGPAEHSCRRRGNAVLLTRLTAR
jgi:hypothetical protein